MDREHTVTSNANQLLNIVIGNHSSDASALRQALGVRQLGGRITGFVQINHQNAIAATKAKAMGIGGSTVKPRASLAVAFFEFEATAVPVVTFNRRRQRGVRD